MRFRLSHRNRAARSRARAQDGRLGSVPTPDDLAALQPLDRRVRVRWWLEGALAAAIAGVVAAVAEFAVFPDVLPDPPPRGLLTGAISGCSAALAAAVPVLRYRRWRYAVRPHDIWLRSGVLVERVSVIPLARLQFIDTRQGPLDRLLGLARLVVHTAALGTAGTLPGLDAAEAEVLRERLAQVSGGAPDG